MPLFALPRPTAAATLVLLTAISISNRENSHQVVAFAPVTTANDSCRIGTFETHNYNGRLSPAYSSLTSSEETNATEKIAPKKRKIIKPQRKNNKSTTQHNSSKENSTHKHKNNNKSKIRSPKSFKPLKDLRLGSKLSGKVVEVCDFGAFINIGYATRGSRPGTALLHISQIRDERIDNIHDVIRKGEVVEDARVINVDLAKGEVGLSLRSRRPKRRELNTVQIGEELEGKVDKVVSYGVFVDVGVNVNALLHISRITGGAIENIRHHLNEGDPVTVHVIDVDVEKKTMAVSMLDRKADLYLDRRLSQKMKKFYGTSKLNGDYDYEEEDDNISELDYFDQAIRELEEALKDRK